MPLYKGRLYGEHSRKTTIFVYNTAIAQLFSMTFVAYAVTCATYILVIINRCLDVR